jgi:hypothetical protein
MGNGPNGAPPATAGEAMKGRYWLCEGLAGKGAWVTRKKWLKGLFLQGWLAGIRGESQFVVGSGAGKDSFEAGFRAGKAAARPPGKRP